MNAFSEIQRVHPLDQPHRADADHRRVLSPWLRWPMRLFWRALEVLDYLLRQTRLCMLDMVRRPGRRRDQPQGAIPGRPPGRRRAPITYVDHAAGHGTELFEKMWDIGGRADRLQPVAKISVLPRAR